MKSCLTQDELNQFLAFRIHNNPLHEDLAFRCELANCWSEPLGILTYFFARILEARDDKDEDNIHYINTLYELPDSMYLEIQELDFNFVSLMMRIIRRSDYSLEDDLVELYTASMNHDYTRTLRY